MRQNTAAGAMAILLLAAIPGLSDTKVTTSYIAEGQTVETTIYANGERVRYDYGKGLILIRQCDRKRMIQLDDQAKTYLNLPMEQAGAGMSSKTQITDTGERKEIFGYSARHLKMNVTTEGKKERSETDGWYTDLKDMAGCSGQDTGSENRGYPMGYTITTYGENGKPSSTVSMRVTAVTADRLDAALFEIPAGYKDADRTAAEKPAGAVRIGAPALQNKFSTQVQGAAPYNQLFATLREAKLDVIPLGDRTPDGIEQKARETQCDYVLYTELAGLEKPAAGKIGGMLHRAASISHVTNGEAVEAQVNYRLVPMNGASPVLASSAIGKMGGSINWKNTAMLASNFIPMTMAAKLIGGSGALNPAMMNALLSGKGGLGASMTSADPMMGGMSMFLRAVNLAPGGNGNANEANASAASALAAALDIEAKAIVAQLTTPSR